MTGFSSDPLMPADASHAAAGTALWRRCGPDAGREDAPYSAQDVATSTCTADWNGHGDGDSDEAKKEEKDFDFYDEEVDDADDADDLEDDDFFDDEGAEDVEDMEDDEDVVLGEDDFEEE